MHWHSCWTPCFWHNNVRDGSLATSIYTFTFSLLIITYCVYVMTGGDSSQLWLPFFETSLVEDALPAAGFVVFFFVFFALFSVLLSVGIFTEIRALYIPWFSAMIIVCVFQATFGLWLIFGYYIYLEVVFVALCCWTWMVLNIYSWQVVRSHYNNVRLIQSPDIEFVNQY